VFRATVLAGQPANIEIADGVDAAASSNGSGPKSVSVRVTDMHGNPVAGTPVTFDVDSAGGSVVPTRTTTDAEGLASTRWTLGTDGAEHVLRASLEGSDIGVEFRAAAASLLRTVPGLAVGGTHTCGLNAQGRLNCWGSNEHGQL